MLVEAFHLADHRFLPRAPPPEYSGGKTDYRSNFDGPTIGLSIDLAGDDCVKRADKQDRRAEPGPPGRAWSSMAASGRWAALAWSIAQLLVPIGRPVPRGLAHH